MTESSDEYRYGIDEVDAETGDDDYLWFERVFASVTIVLMIAAIPSLVWSFVATNTVTDLLTYFSYLFFFLSYCLIFTQIIRFQYVKERLSIIGIVGATFTGIGLGIASFTHAAVPLVSMEQAVFIVMVAVTVYVIVFVE